MGTRASPPAASPNGAHPSVLAATLSNEPTRSYRLLRDDGHMSRDDKRWSLALVFGLMLYIAIFWLSDRHGTFALWSVQLASDDWLQHRVLARKNIASVIQIVGSVIAAIGLLSAYVRTKYHLSVPQWLQVSAHLTLRPELTATAYVTFNLDPNATVQEQVKDLARFVNDRSRDTVFVDEKFIEIERKLRILRSDLDDLERNTMQRTDSQLHKIQARAYETDALDLTWAIWGIVIIAIGTAWGLGA